jgi:hypothetical protein
MSDDNSLERQLGRPLRPALPPAEADLDDEPLTRRARAKVHSPEHWPEEKAAAPPSGDFTVTEGELLQTLEWYFPLFWAASLIIVSYIGIYYAVDKLSSANPLPPAWF